MADNKNSFFNNLGMAVGNSVAGQGLGLIFGAIGRKAQQNQQERLNEQQIKAQAKMGALNNQQALDLWNKTNYGAQVEHMKEAGLNIGLMYGGAGAGGSTGANAGSVTGGQAEGASQQTAMGLQLASQLSLMKAQKENIEADTEQKKAQTAETGLDTELKANTLDSETERIKQQLTKEIAEIVSLENRNIIDRETQQAQIKRIEAEAIGQVLDNELTKAKTNLTRSQTNQVEEAIVQAWRSLALESRKVTVAELQQATNERLGVRGLNLAQAGLDEAQQQNMFNNVIGIMGITTGKKGKK